MRMTACHEQQSLSLHVTFVCEMYQKFPLTTDPGSQLLKTYQRISSQTLQLSGV